MPSETIETPDAPFTRGLNPAQRVAVLHDAGPLVVLAGPGAGKTHVIVHRLARLVAQIDDGGAGAEPERVVALAYTVKAAEELRSRVEAMVGAEVAQRMRIGTSHSFGRSIVRRFGDAIGLPWNHHISDSAERIRLLRELVGVHALPVSRAAGGLDGALRIALNFIHACHTDAIEPEDAHAWVERRRARLDAGEHDLTEIDAAAERARIDADSEHAALYALYEDARLQRGLLTLDDYILLPIRILRDCDRPRAILQAECAHVIVDEFQDWNPAQIRLLALLCPASRGARGPDLCVVGDDDQSIYAFRGADDRAFERFAAIWPGHTPVALSINYRSEAPIIAAGNTILSGAESRFAPEKVVEPDPARSPDASARIEGVLATKEQEIGAIIAAMIREDHESTGRALAEYAVLARTGSEADRCAVALEMEGVRVNRRQKRTPLDDQAVRDLLAWCALLVDESRGPDVQRVLVRPPIGVFVRDVQRWHGEFQRARSEGDGRSFLRWTLQERSAHEGVQRMARLLTTLQDSAHSLPADRAVNAIIRAIDLPHAEPLDGRKRARRIEDLITVLRFVRERVDHLDPPGDLAAFLRHYRDLDEKEQAFMHAGDNRVDSDEEEMEEDADGVVVLTAHSAKGLEFDTVFIPRCRPPHGFPHTAGGAEERLLSDPDLTGRRPSSPIDEERRLFYVACTRAERRLVLLAKKRKQKRSSATDFFDELAQNQADCHAPVADGDDWLKRASRTRPDAGDFAIADAHGDVAAWLDEQSMLARQQASGLLHDAASAELDSGAVEGIGERLAALAGRLQALSVARRHGALPDSVGAGDPLRAAFERRRRGDGSEPTIVRPMEAPLTLSYSKLTDYEKCPRCFYVKYALRLDEPRTEALFIGSIVHGAIERFLDEHRLAEAEGLALPDLARLLALGERRYEQATPRSQPLDPEARERVGALLSRYFKCFHDAHAEILIVEGQDADAGDEDGERGVMRPFPYTTADAPDIAHSIIAKPDRVERMGNGAFRIVDYKTGNALKRLVNPEKGDLQLAIYALAVQRHFELDEPPLGVAEYWLLATGERGVIDIADLNLARVRARIDRAIDGMLGGRFPRNPRDCKCLCDLLPHDDEQGALGGEPE